MDSSELIKKVRKIEIRTKALSQQIFSGQYHSAFKGLGMVFREVRQYDYGDDIRFIDWNVTARFRQPYVKIFEEERELTVMLLIDVSASNLFGTHTTTKAELITELAAVLSFSAIHNNDKVGVIFFSDRVEKFIPPKKGRSHILRIIRELVAYEPASTRTNVGEALRYLTNAIKKKCTTFLISDFLNSDFEKPLKIAANKHDLVALHIVDKGEMTLPNLGLVEMLDAESGKRYLANTSNKKTRLLHKKWWENTFHQSNALFQKVGVDMTRLYTNVDYIPQLIALFKKRA